jgi:uncharacterized protein (DUF1499 family)
MKGSNFPARLTFAIGLLAILAFATGPLLAHAEMVPPIAGFGVFALGILLSLATIVIGLFYALRGRGAGALWIGLLLALVVVGVTARAASRGRGVPRINDITTDTQNPPAFTHAQSLPGNQGRDMSYPGEGFAQQQRDGYRELAGLPVAMAPDQAFSRVQLAAHGFPKWTITEEDMQGHRLEGYETSDMFRFKDDFVIEVRPAATGSVVQMRSKSRDGKGDLGVNARRIAAFFEKLK